MSPLKLLLFKDIRNMENNLIVNENIDNKKILKKKYKNHLKIRKSLWKTKYGYLRHDKRAAILIDYYNLPLGPINIIIDYLRSLESINVFLSYRLDSLLLHRYQCRCIFIDFYNSTYIRSSYPDKFIDCIIEYCKFCGKDILNKKQNSYKLSLYRELEFLSIFFNFNNKKTLPYVTDIQFLDILYITYLFKPYDFFHPSMISENIMCFNTMLEIMRDYVGHIATTFTIQDFQDFVHDIRETTINFIFKLIKQKRAKMKPTFDYINNMRKK